MTCDREIELLKKWASDLDLWIKPDSLGKFKRGRREHDLFGEGSEGHIFKITRGTGFGLFPYHDAELVSSMVSDWFAVFPATPRQYFQRLTLSNELYPDLNTLEGFCEFEGRFAVVTSQPFIAGRNATEREISDFMEERKFTCLCSSTWFRPEDGLAIFDVGGSNLFSTESGELVPIDVIPVLARGNFLKRLREAWHRVKS